MKDLSRVEVVRSEFIRRDANANIPLTRYCAYRKWIPHLAEKCICWGCYNRRQAFAVSKYQLRKKYGSQNATNANPIGQNQIDVRSSQGSLLSTVRLLPS